MDKWKEGDRAYLNWDVQTKVGMLGKEGMEVEIDHILENDDYPYIVGPVNSEGKYVHGVGTFGVAACELRKKEQPGDLNKDPYNAGPCPRCGEFATGTYRHTGAPVFCKNKHEWERPTNTLAVDYHLQRVPMEIRELAKTNAFIQQFVNTFLQSGDYVRSLESVVVQLAKDNDHKQEIMLGYELARATPPIIHTDKKHD